MEITERTINLNNSVIFDNLTFYQCPRCGTITYFYDDNRLVFVTTHRNTLLQHDEAYFVPRCQRCDAEFAHMLKAIELMRKQGDP